ncbi:MAG: hypothetical protein H0U76_19040 [Ktedonobacteraceae bacterium]|nr:hypothetical protein [Ktedonobacteraceae bacterium]
MDVKVLLEDSLREARAEAIEGLPGGELHRARAQAWIKNLAKNFQKEYADARVFSKYDHLNRPDFGLNEYLHDILVCRLAPAASASHGKKLFYIKDVLWQVESEFARDSRQALIDFNKLVLGSAQDKLFVGPQVNNPETFLGVLLNAACACTGTVYVALVSHPDEWGRKPDWIDVWKLLDQQWVPVASPTL